MQPIPYSATTGLAMVQPKFDGVRGVLTSAGMFSRNGLVLNNCGPLLDLLPQMGDVVLDGELVAGCFEDTCSLLLSGEGRDASRLRFHVFDIVPAADWQEGCTMPLVERDKWIGAY